ncbi:MAG: biotin--[acetyl-CoA-carboxylase] ligase [Prevotella sp.]|nr:biotin--[acetyl-CoA-carboxylase] ligase [Prevotella sp.]
MTFDITHIEETESTNRWLMEHASKRADAVSQDLVVWADYQTAGRGCGTNTWESERGKNLLFSLLIHPHELKANAQFRISMAISMAIVNALNAYISPLTTLPSPLSIKWPNDIYWHDSKLCGILIENSLSGAFVRESIIGVGLNVNQTQFLSDAPNPVSLRQITGREHDRESLLHRVVEHFTLNINADDYRALLYRRHGFHPYHDAEGDFEAELITVEDDGHLLLRDSEGKQRRYAFKEVQFTINNRQ